MITIKNVRTLDGEMTNHAIPSSKDYVIEAKEKWLLLPGVIDPHICLGAMDQESWNSAIHSAIRGGLTTLIEIPSKHLPLSARKDLELKKQEVTQRLSHLQIPLHYALYSSANLNQIEELGLGKKLMKGIVLLLDPAKGEELDDRWESVFRLAAQEDLPLVVNTRNENSQERPQVKGHEASLLERAIYYTEKQSARLYVLNIATQQEIDLIQEARNRSLLVYAETTPQHLFPEKPFQAEPLWEALDKGVIETIGSGYHVDHQGEGRALFNGDNFSFLNPLFLLPLLLTAFQERKISIEKLVQLTRSNIHDIFAIEKNHDVVLVDLEKEQTIRRLIHEGHFIDMKLRGWPVYTVVQGQLFSSPQTGYSLIRPD